MSTVDEFDLAKMDENFGQAEVEKRDFDPLPDGLYQVNVEKVELGRARTTGSPMLKWQLRVMGPRCQGRYLFKNNVFGKPENLGWIKTDLHTCGLDLDRLSDLPTRLVDLLDVKLEVAKKTKGENESVYFRKRLTDEEAKKLDADAAQAAGNSF